MQRVSPTGHLMLRRSRHPMNLPAAACWQSWHPGELSLMPKHPGIFSLASSSWRRFACCRGHFPLRASFTPAAASSSSVFLGRSFRFLAFGGARLRSWAALLFGGFFFAFFLSAAFFFGLVFAAAFFFFLVSLRWSFFAVRRPPSPGFGHAGGLLKAVVVGDRERHRVLTGRVVGVGRRHAGARRVPSPQLQA